MGCRAGFMAEVGATPISICLMILVPTIGKVVYKAKKTQLAGHHTVEAANEIVGIE